MQEIFGCENDDTPSGRQVVERLPEIVDLDVDVEGAISGNACFRKGKDAVLMKEPPMSAIKLETRYARKCWMLTHITRHRGSQSARIMTQHLYVNFR